MKKIFAKILIGLLLLGMIIASGCIGGPAPPKEQPPSEKPPTEKPPAERPAPGSVEAIHFSKLIEFLSPAPSGWKEEEPQGFTFTIENGTWSQAVKSYTKKGTEESENPVTVQVGIMDSAYYTVGWWAVWKGFYKWETTEGYAKTTTVKGYPAFEIYNKPGKDYTLYVGMKDRFMVFITTKNSDRDTLYDFANSINYNGIAALG